jgi:serine protease inhibitor
MDRRSLFTIGAALFGSTVFAGCTTALPGPAEPSARLVPTPGPGSAVMLNSCVLEFAGELLQRLVTKDPNAVCSPWSVAMVLSMLREGAREQTGAEIDHVLGTSAPQLGDELADGYRRMQASGRIQVANALWGQQGFAWNESFLARLRDGYFAPLAQTDFSGNTEQSRLAINDWVSRQTTGKIPDLLEPGTLTPDTRLVLANALHFAAPWIQPLAEMGLKPFRTPTGESVSVETLSGGGWWPWLSGDGWRGTALPCEGHDFALVVVQPETEDAGAKPVPGHLFTEVLTAEPTSVSVQLPAWKFSLKVQLKELLRDLGITAAFDPDRADLGAMTASERLYVGFVVHQSVFEVNAKGIEAAAATAGGAVAGAGAVDPKTLILDRRFSYALMHVPTQTPLFVGQVADPTQTGA